jgi:glycosyltransferase involved in cell wall biosynthesis
VSDDSPATVMAHGSDPHAAHVRVAIVAGLASGGTARHVAALASGCRDAGLSVSVLAPAATLRRLRTTAAVVPLAFGDRPRPLRDARSAARLRSWVTAWQPNVVHAHGVRAGALAALAIGLTRRPARPALVVTVHNAPPEGRAASVVHAVLERTCARRADLLLCASADLGARLRTRGAAAVEQVDVAAPPAPEPTAGEAAAARAEIAESGRPVILAVGRLTPQKGLDVFLAAAARWRHRDPPPVAVIVGDGPLAGPLRAEAARQADGDVRLLGERDDVPALLAAADVVVVPSRWEARALIVQEAMRAGRPIVATRVGGIPELTGEDGAVLVSPGDPVELAVAVTALLDDPAKAAQIGRAARARAATFPSPDEELTGMLSRYARLAASRSPGSARRPR